jgi:hypothetical protein|tara:strand:+ start:706 stop:879 length:174 start_codon:yes stop_codon:yes gene_type:complete
MGKIGFNTTSKKEESLDLNIVKTDQVENYSHKIKLLGLPLWTSIKVHTIDTKTVEEK